ncbi:hypothetical protein AX16_005274 [Volvariella volvacea WC 439]|nr:hypothetical protein AX16_005274 [Volvariella volvacea WC 439]
MTCTTTTTAMPTKKANGSISFALPTVAVGHFAFARVHGEVCLIQLETPLTPLSKTTTVKLFRHEFITIFRYSETLALHPSEMHIIEPIDDSLTRYEPDSETLFLARDLMDRLRKLSDRRLSAMRMTTAHSRLRSHAHMQTYSAYSHAHAHPTTGRYLMSHAQHHRSTAA